MNSEYQTPPIQTLMLINRHWVIMAYSEKLSDIIDLEKCEVYSTKKANIAFALA